MFSGNKETFSLNNPSDPLAAGLIGWKTNAHCMVHKLSKTRRGETNCSASSAWWVNKYMIPDSHQQHSKQVWMSCVSVDVSLASVVIVHHKQQCTKSQHVYGCLLLSIDCYIHDFDHSYCMYIVLNHNHSNHSEDHQPILKPHCCCRLALRMCIISWPLNIP